MTNVKYDFQIFNNDKNIFNKSGNAVLSSMFYLASEVDEDSESGTSYGSSEYWDKSSSCWFSIRIGNGIDENGKQRAIVDYSCNEKNKQIINLDECPTLRTE